MDAADISAIRALERLWLDFETSGQTDSLKSLMIDDCRLVLPDGEPVEGLDAIVEACRPTGEIENISLTDVAIHGGSTAAWKTARFETRLKIEDTTLLICGHHLWWLVNTAYGWKVRQFGFEVESVTPE